MTEWFHVGEASTFLRRRPQAVASPRSRRLPSAERRRAAVDAGRGCRGGRVYDWEGGSLWR